MNLLHSPRFQRWVSRHQLCRVAGAIGCFGLTFDDGPSPRNTARLLEILGRHGARATFFLLAPHVRRHPELVRRLVQEGHEAAIHGNLHLPAALLPRPGLARELHRAAGAVRDVTGASPRFYRAPFGLLTPGQARLVRRWGFEPVLGDVYPKDAEGNSAARIVVEVRARIGPGSILILHDASVWGDHGREATLAAVDTLLPVMAAQGLRAVTLSELGTAGDGGGGDAERLSRAPP